MTMDDRRRTHDELTQADRRRIEALSRELPMIASLINADVFLDCILDEETAVVVAQARSALGSSVYGGDVVGAVARRLDEPAVFHAFYLGTPVCDLKAITQEARQVRQNAVPVYGDDGAIIAVLIREKDVSDDMRQASRYAALARSYARGAPEVRTRESALEGEALREMHHRVKNNLQLVASILNLQARKCTGPDVKKMLREDVERVLSIAAIHDILTNTAEGAHLVRTDALLRRLCWNYRSLIPAGCDVSIEVDGEPLMLSADMAASVSLAVTELVTNALQHAFAGRDRGRIVIATNPGLKFHTVTVADNGVGFVPGRDEGLGLRIVRAVVQDKLSGQLHITSDGAGTTVSFDFAITEEN